MRYAVCVCVSLNYCYSDIQRIIMHLLILVQLKRKHTCLQCGLFFLFVFVLKDKHAVSSHSFKMNSLKKVSHECFSFYPDHE